MAEYPRTVLEFRDWFADDAACRDYLAKLTEWRDRALSGAATSLKERERDDRDDEIARLKSKVGEICSASIWMETRRQSGWPFWRSRREDDCRGATVTQAIFS